VGGWPVYSPRNHVELAILESILMGDGVTYFVHNRHFGALRVGPSIALFNRITILVSDEDVDRAQELLDEYLESTETRWRESRPYGLRDRLRVMLEFLAFGWFIPGRRWHWARQDDDG
jgi:hypothetical protein